MGKGLTDWEAGQILCEIHDSMGDAQFDIKDSHPEIRKVIAECRNKIGVEFNKLKSHGFLLPENLT